MYTVQSPKPLRGRRRQQRLVHRRVLQRGGRHVVLRQRHDGGGLDALAHRRAGGDGRFRRPVRRPVSLYGEMTSVHGIDAGYGGASDTLSYASGGASGPFEVSGTSFVERPQARHAGRLQLAGREHVDFGQRRDRRRRGGGHERTLDVYLQHVRQFGRRDGRHAVLRSRPAHPQRHVGPSDTSLVVIERPGRRSTIWATSTRASTTTRRARPPSSPTPGSTATATRL